MLTPIAAIYGQIADFRNRLYERGVLKSRDLGARTISIGNITTGGTGKTPLVALVAKILAEGGEKVCILTRGYGRRNEGMRVLVSDFERVLADIREAGDEPLELARKLLGKAIVVADADRVAAAAWAKSRFGVTAFVLDDGFQHRRAKRDIDILCIDATNPFGGGRMLPAGRLREPLHNLARADAIVITRADLVDDISNLRSEISEANPAAAVFIARSEISGIARLDELHAEPQRKKIEIDRRPAAAFCGLGNPESFYSLLRTNKIDLVSTKSFPDHHMYRQAEIDTLTRDFLRDGVEIVLTTAKDAVKLSDLSVEMPCYVVEIDTIIDDLERFSLMVMAKK